MHWMKWLPVFALSVALGQGTVIFTEDFESGIPANFTLLNLDQNTPHPLVAEYTDAWIAITDPNDSTDTIAAATSYFSLPDTANRWLITPPILLGAFGNYLTWESKSQDASYLDSYLVLLSTTDAQASSFTDTIAFVVGENFEWTFREVDLTTQGYDNQTVLIAFVLRSFDAYKLYINHLEIRSLDNASVEMLASPSLQVFPNPSSDWITVINKPNHSAIRLLDLHGKILESSEDKSLSLATYSPGTYLLICDGFQPVRIVRN
ncbi:MAG: T9SS type A sorting domain-containing protein [Bacteroidetes bacterium]|nr:T9SS type A sorting domain-containing protein [Bacteroidota bacterium]